MLIFLYFTKFSPRKKCKLVHCACIIHFLPLCGRIFHLQDQCQCRNSSNGRCTCFWVDSGSLFSSSSCTGAVKVTRHARWNWKSRCSRWARCRPPRGPTLTNATGKSTGKSQRWVTGRWCRVSSARTTVSCPWKRTAAPSWPAGPPPSATAIRCLSTSTRIASSHMGGWKSRGTHWPLSRTRCRWAKARLAGFTAPRRSMSPARANGPRWPLRYPKVNDVLLEVHGLWH